MNRTSESAHLNFVCHKAEQAAFSISLHANNKNIITNEVKLVPLKAITDTFFT